MKHKKIVIFEGIVVLESALSLGSGEKNNTDADILSDKEGMPYIPATSFMGVLYHTLLPNFNSINSTDDLKKFWGTNKENRSMIICSDLCLVDNDRCLKRIQELKEVRDGIRIDNTKGIVEKEGKFDREVLAAGVKFKFNMEILLKDKENNDSKIFCSIIKQLEKGIQVGAKTSTGLGKIRLLKEQSFLKNFDFSEHADTLEWLDYLNDRTVKGLTKNKSFDESFSQHDDVNEKAFMIEAEFSLNSPLIIRGYSSSPLDPDAVHLKSGNKNIISGSSLKGALRARAEKILNTLGCNTQELIKDLFGWVETETRKSKNKNAKASRFLVNEVEIEDDTVIGQVQNRIKVDRFTGGAIHGALFDSKPIYPKENKTQIKKLIIKIKQAKNSDIGLALLLLKDLWSADIAIGGEKNIGRGTLTGKFARIFLPEDTNPIEIDDKALCESKADKLQEYVAALTSLITN